MFGAFHGSIFSVMPSNPTVKRILIKRTELMKMFPLLMILAALMAVTSTTQARVKLVALPERARVVVSLNNPDATLVEEERLITLQKGVNQIDFSWRGVNIDSTSIQVKALTHPNDVTFLN